MKRKEHKADKLENQNTASPETATEGKEEYMASAEEASKTASDSSCDSVSSESSEVELLKKQLEEKRKEAEENFNKFLRMQADFDNYKKRIARERDELYTLALENIVKELLPVVDNMERALSAFIKDNLDSKYTDGLDMVAKQLIGVLAKNGVKEIEAQDKEFDPNIHHAVMQQEGEEENKVTDVFQKGYTLGSKVIRPSMVKVSIKNS